MRTDEQIAAIRAQAREQQDLADKITAYRKQIEELRTAKFGNTLIRADEYNGSWFHVTDPYTQEAMRMLLIVDYTRLADEAEVKLKG